MGVRVLLIEDDETIAEPLADGLRHFGLTVHHVATGADGLRGPYGDVVLLDLGLPDMDGIDVCRGIRRTSDVPLIILSARGEEADRVLGLELGADDYLAKPFSIRELVARIRAVSRRHQRPGSGTAPDVVAGVVVAEAGVDTGTTEAGTGTAGAGTGTAGGGPGAGTRTGAGIGAGAGAGAGAGTSAHAGTRAGAWGRSGGGERSGAGFGAGAGIGFGAENDFTAPSTFETPNGFAGGDDARRVGDEGPDQGAVGAAGRGDGPGDRRAGRHRAGGLGAGARGAQYDWSAAYEARAQEAEAPGEAARGTSDRAGSPTYGSPAYGSPAYDSPAHEGPAYGAPAHGAPPHGSPAFPNPPYGTPAHGTPTLGNPLYEPPVPQPPAYAPSVPHPPAYEPPMYEQAPPEPRPPSGRAADDEGGSAPPQPGPLVVDRRTRQVWVGEVPVALTPKEFELLALLTEDPGAVYSRQQILNRVWDDHYQGPTKTLDVHVATLRRKLGDPAWIQTLRGVGFRLAVRTPGPASGPGLGRPPGHEQGPGRGRGAGSGRHRTSGARAS
ncbi:winged helix-turn-helix domain-containing protein [Streptomyces sp. NPDC057438]|uniref:winged helix-turn-helix domain-containing protein n=1 Tax=Streptomyces sp. NPDC057438 TaxID=3346133 RepID=UPI0036AE2647